MRIVPLAELLDRLPEVHALYTEAAADMPADNPEGNVSLDEWLSETIGSPDLDRELSVVVLVDDRPAALSWVNADRSARRSQTTTSRAPRGPTAAGASRASRSWRSFGVAPRRASPAS